MYPIRKILHPTDFSEQAGAAFGLACSLARAHGATVTVLHVIAPALTWNEEVARSGLDAYRDQLWNDFLLPLKATEPGVQILHQIEEGSISETIVEVAHTGSYDLLVIGTHGRSGISRFLMGSVAEKLLRAAPCPVLIVRNPIPEKVTPPTEANELITEPARVPIANAHKHADRLADVELGFGD